MSTRSLLPSKTSHAAGAAAGGSNSFEGLDVTLHRLMWLERNWLKQALTGHDLDIARFMILGVIARRGGRCGIGELAQELDQPNGTMTGHVDSLEQQRLVTRETADTRDRRKVCVQLLPRGSVLLKRVQKARTRHLTQALARLDEGDRQQFVRLLQLYLNELEHGK